jgi:hypothetical protein
MNRKSFLNIFIIAVIVAGLVGLNLLFYVKPEPPQEDELTGDRSTYCARAYGTLGYYTLLEESGYPVGRWRRPYTELKDSPAVRALVIVSPRQQSKPGKKEFEALKKWIAEGGTVVIFERGFTLDFGKQMLVTGRRLPPLKDDKSSVFEKSILHAADPWQPLPMFGGVKRLALSEEATEVRLVARDTSAPPPSGPKTPKTKSEDGDDDTGFGEQEDEDLPLFGPPEEKKAAPEDLTEIGFLPLAGADGVPFFGELRYGKGRVLCLTDPYVVANNGIKEGDNATFALNLASAALRETGRDDRIVFDEYHHGFSESGRGMSGMYAYFRGTPVPWIALHLAVCSLLVAFTAGRRFARPLPMPRRNRASTLEFVDAMAQIQQTAESYDLAIENLYTRFHRAICRYAGVPTTAPLKLIAEATARRSGREASEIRALLERCQEIIAGKQTTEAEMVKLARRMRELETDLFAPHKPATR